MTRVGSRSHLVVLKQDNEPSPESDVDENVRMNGVFSGHSCDTGLANMSHVQN